VKVTPNYKAKKNGMLAPILMITALIFMLFSLVPHASSWASESQLVDAERLQDIFSTYVKKKGPWKEADVEITNLRVLPKRIWVHVGKVSFEFDSEALAFHLGRVSAVATILVDGRPVRKARVCGYVEVYKKILCAKNGLSKGQVILPGDLSLVRLPISKLRGRFFDSPGQVSGLAAKRSIRPGQVLLATDVAKPVLVKRGSRVLIVAASPNLRITVPGIVEQRGAQGDYVRVKNLDSKRVVVARVQDENTVLVNF